MTQHLKLITATVRPHIVDDVIAALAKVGM
jgi:nitrogen regulatory protein PII